MNKLQPKKFNLFGAYKNPVIATISVILGIIYFIIPPDLIIDITPILGYLDDLIIGLTIAIKALKTIKKFFKNKQQ